MTPINERLRHANLFMKGTASLVLAAFLSLTLQPLAIAANTPAPARAAPKEESTEEKLEKTLNAIQGNAERIERKSIKKESIQKEAEEINRLKSELDSLDSIMRRDFDQVGLELANKRLPSIIFDRHAAAVRTYRQQISALKADTAALISATSFGARKIKAGQIKESLRARIERPSIAISRDSLPARVMPTNRANTPKLSKADFTSSGLYDNPRIQLAALGDFTFDRLAAAGDPAYLGPTQEIVISDAIKARAQELEYNPVKIFAWVHDNIEWVPSWGAMQNSDLVLRSLKGNAIDTSSLLIALLRASGIPARYVHGTIDVKPEILMNWAGGFTDVNSAWDYVSSGGVPFVGLTSGGTVSKFRMEHVWVEAAIDFHPSRGSINKAADSWIALDASFKKLLIAPGFDATSSTPFDSAVYLSEVRTENPVAYYQQRVQAALAASGAEKGVGDAMGFNVIAPFSASVLPAGLPNQVVVAANRYGVLPQALRVSVQFEFAAPRAIEPEVAAFDTSMLAGKRLTLSYAPASAADAATIESYGGDLYAVPPYLLSLVPTIKLDGAVIFQGGAVQMGQEHTVAVSYRGPTIYAPSMPHKLISGGYYAVGLNLQGASGYTVGDNNVRLVNLLSGTTASTDNDALIGEHLAALIDTYFLTNDKHYRGAAKLYQVAESRAPSVGLAAFTLTVRYRFGIPYTASPNRAQLDVGLEAGQAAALHGDRDKLTRYLSLRGLMGSFSEHAIFENIHGFTGISAVKALQIANTQSIPIHEINAANFDQLFPLLQLSSDDRLEIQQGVQAGLTAIVPEREFAIDEWRGVGFIVKDPVTAAGVYRISGGLSGGSTTKQNDGFQIVSLFKGAFAWLKDKLDLMTRNYIVTSASADAASGDASDEDVFYEFISQGITVWKGTSYEAIGRCTGFVSRAYASAGIVLDDLAQQMKTGNPLWTPNLYKLANALKINDSVRTSEPLAGDIIFWNHTYERNFNESGIPRTPNCVLADEDQPTHVGIVERIQADGTVQYAHAGSKGVGSGKMNIAKRSDTSSNSFLRNYAQLKSDGSYCPSDGKWNASSPGIGVLSGELFSGYATVRIGY